MPSKDTTPRDYFLRLADRGRKPGASTFERRAWLVAVAVAHMADGADGQALRGMAEFVRTAVEAPGNVSMWVSVRAEAKP